MHDAVPAAGRFAPWHMPVTFQAICNCIDAEVFIFKKHLLERKESMLSVFHRRFALILTCALSVVPALAQSSTPYDAVNPFIGTAGGGNTFPGASLPFGMVQWSPDTNQDAWYFYNDKQI